MSNVESKSHLIKLKLELRSRSCQMCPSEPCYVSKTGMHVYLSAIDKYVNYSF